MHLNKVFAVGQTPARFFFIAVFTAVQAGVFMWSVRKDSLRHRRRNCGFRGVVLQQEASAAPDETRLKQS
jgi:hypothetical protein